MKPSGEVSVTVDGLWCRVQIRWFSCSRVMRVVNRDVPPWAVYGAGTHRGLRGRSPLVRRRIRESGGCVDKFTFNKWTPTSEYWLAEKWKFNEKFTRGSGFISL